MKLRKRYGLKLVAAMFMVGVLACGFTAYAKESDNAIESVDDLEGKVIGVQLGTTGDIYASEYEDDGTAKVEKYTKGNDAVMALKQGKVDCVIIDEQPALQFTKVNPDLKVLEEEFALEEYAICVKKGNKEILDELNYALGVLKENGTLERIIDSYINNEDGSLEKYTKKDVKRNGKLVMATNAEFPPYESRLEVGGITGIDVDIATAMCDILGKELEIEDIAFDSIIPAVQTDKAQFGMAGMTVTEDRLKNIDFTNTYTTSKQVIIVKDNEYVSGDSKKDRTLKDKFYDDFIKDSRWKNLTAGLKNTLVITFFSAIIGIVIGFVLAMIRSTYDRTGKLTILNFFARIYLTIIRGTPTVVQLLIIYYVVFASVNVNKNLAAVIAFGINSGAYVAEIVRSGIMSTPQGQMEAGRSLGLSYWQTMTSIILPQALKSVLPALGNESIVLLKETSICGYIGLVDITRGGDTIRSITYDAMLPLFAVALCYLVMVMILSSLVNCLERRLRKNER